MKKAIEAAIAAGLDPKQLAGLAEQVADEMTITITRAAAAVRPLKPELPDDHPCDPCPNCGWTGTEAELRTRFPAIPDLTQRVDVGEPVPAGECPNCGALCHRAESPKPKPFNVLAEIRQQAEDAVRCLTGDRPDPNGAVLCLNAILGMAEGESGESQLLKACKAAAKFIGYGHGDQIEVWDRLNSAIGERANKLAQPITRKLVVLIEVTGGVAEVTSCPAGVSVEIVDHDNAKVGE